MFHHNFVLLFKMQIGYCIQGSKSAGVAQQVEQLICNQQVGGSNPLGGFLKHDNDNKNYSSGELRTNCYIVASEKTREAVIIDPGDEAEKIMKAIDSEKLKPILIVNTHAHPDHVGANQELAKRYGIAAMLGVGGVINVGELKFNVIKTPGHSKGSICLYARPDEGG